MYLETGVNPTPHPLISAFYFSHVCYLPVPFCSFEEASPAGCVGHCVKGSTEQHDQYKHTHTHINTSAFVNVLCVSCCLISGLHAACVLPAREIIARPLFPVLYFA